MYVGKKYKHAQEEEKVRNFFPSSLLKIPQDICFF